MTTPEVGATVTGRCICHTGGTVTGTIDRIEIVRMSGRPIRVLYVRNPRSTACHSVPVGNLMKEGSA